MALPLRARGGAGHSNIIGALDVQSTLPEAFSKEDVATLQTLADQVAMAISNAQLFQQVQESLEVERKAYGELSRTAWLNLLSARPDLSYRYEQRQVIPAGDIVAETKHTDVGLPELMLPVKYRDQTIGTIVAHKVTSASGWTSEEITLMETLADQLSTALDSARLYQDTQRRAVQEQLVGEITTHMRESLDMETVLKTAVNEMRQALGLEGVIVQLARPETIGDAE
jgi:GAF domain-containing protein